MQSEGPFVEQDEPYDNKCKTECFDRNNPGHNFAKRKALLRVQPEAYFEQSFGNVTFSDQSWNLFDSQAFFQSYFGR